jgi:hypothetical protein
MSHSMIFSDFGGVSMRSRAHTPKSGPLPQCFPMNPKTGYIFVNGTLSKYLDALNFNQPIASGQVGVKFYPESWKYLAGEIQYGLPLAGFNFK